MPPLPAEVDIKGSGSSFAGNFMIDGASRYMAKTGNKVTYTATSSSEGRGSFAAGTIDFAASDSVYGPTESTPGNYKVVPVIGGPVAIVFNVAGVNNLRLDAATVSGIFGGTITKWNDPAIAALNPSAMLQNNNIEVVYRSSNSGTTQNFQEYLQQSVGGIWPAGNQAWVGVKTGSGQPASAALVAKVKDTSYSIGYADLSEVGVKLGKVTLKNAWGQFVKPTVATTAKMLSKQTIAADGAMTFDYRIKTPGAYQLSRITYLMIPAAGAKAAAVKAFATYAVDTVSKKPVAGYARFTGANYRRALALASS